MRQSDEPWRFHTNHGSQKAPHDKKHPPRSIPIMTTDPEHDITPLEREVLKAAKAYGNAAYEAYAVQRANGRRGASAAAVDQVNRYRARAKEAHDRLMAALDALGGDQS